MNIQEYIKKEIKKAIFLIGLDKKLKFYISKSNKKVQLCDYQVNGIISIAKKINYSPEKLAYKIIQKIYLKKIFKLIKFSSPGFINIIINTKWLEDQLNKINSNKNFFLTLKEKNLKTIVIDYSSPNIAKEMHVGHLRSTIIGDAISNVLIYLGHKVIKANHIGDWGIQFGIIIAFLKIKKIYNINFNDLEKIYVKAKKYFDTDEIFAKTSRSYVVKLQSGDKNCLKLWKKLINITILKNKKIYKMLNVSLTDKDIIGESFYNYLLPEIVNDLKQKKIAVENNGAIVVFLDEFKNKKGESIGVVIKKKDGGYLYTTIDIACVKHRCQKLNADRILYFVDSRQNQHLMQVFIIAKKAGYITSKTSFEHHMFGMILGQNGKPFKTRDGMTIKLFSLLQEAIKRAISLVKKKNPYMNNKDVLLIAKRIGIGAVKYFDLSKNSQNNYVFNWNNILNFNGNTSPYIQYAYTRILSIIKKSKINKKGDILKNKIFISKEEEKELAIHLIRFKEILQTMGKFCTPHILCNYLYDLSCLFSSFYETCKILSKNKQVNLSRLKLSYLTAKTLKIGLSILGIKTINKM